LLPRPTHRSRLFPYTTLFRSGSGPATGHGDVLLPADRVRDGGGPVAGAGRELPQQLTGLSVEGVEGTGRIAGEDQPASGGEDRRSEEHTSELQSRGHLVCGLL